MCSLVVALVPPAQGVTELIMFTLSVDIAVEPHVPPLVCPIGIRWVQRGTCGS